MEQQPPRRELSGAGVFLLSAAASAALLGGALAGAMRWMSDRRVFYAALALYGALAGLALAGRRRGSAGALGVGALLLLIAFPKMEGCESYVREGEISGRLGLMRQWVQEQRGPGGFPKEIPAALVVPLRLPEHGSSSEVRLVSLGAEGRERPGGAEPDGGTWAYDPGRGEVFVNCTHLMRQRGEPWWTR